MPTSQGEMYPLLLPVREVQRNLSPVLLPFPRRCSIGQCTVGHCTFRPGTESARFKEAPREGRKSDLEVEKPKNHNPDQVTKVSIFSDRSC